MITQKNKIGGDSKKNLWINTFLSDDDDVITLCRCASGQDLLSVAIDRSVEPNRTGKRNQVNSTRNHR